MQGAELQQDAARDAAMLEFLTQFITDERRQHHRIYIDGAASRAWGKPEKHRCALKLAALLGYLAVNGSDRVSWYALEGDE